MPHKSRFLYVILPLLLASPFVFAQERVVALPGANSDGEHVQLLQPRTLHDAGGLTAAPGAFKAFMSSDGARLLILSNSADAGWLTVTDLSGQSIAEPKKISPEIAQAHVTPDRRKLLVLSLAGLDVFDLTGTTVRLAATFSVGSSGLDFSVSHDSLAAYVLNPGAQRLYAVDLSDLSGMFEIPVPSTAYAVATGPNGLVYVTATQRVLEIDGGSGLNEPTLRRTINLPTNFLPGRAAFTPDGKRLVVANRGAVGAAAVAYALETGSLHSIIRAGATFTEVVVPTNEYAYALGLGRVWVLDFASASPGEPEFAFAETVESIALSSEASRAGSLYVKTANSTVTHVDLNLFRRTAEGLASGQLACVSSGYTGAPSGVFGIHTAITAAPGARIAPLVVRALDVAGHRLMNRPVSWSADPELVVRHTMSTTNVEGYAQAQYTAPETPGTYIVMAAVDGLRVQFTITVTGTPGDDGGGGGPVNQGRLVVIRGQGQVMQLGGMLTHPITVQVRNENGEPVSGAVVEWNLSTLEAGTAIIFGNGCDGSFSTRTCETDDEGKSTISFAGQTIPTNSNYSQFKLTASNGGYEVDVYVTVLKSGKALERQVEEPNIGATLTLRRGERLPGAIKVRTWTEGVTGIPNVGVSVSAQNANIKVQCSGGWALTDENGVASCDLVATEGLGETRLTIEVAGVAEFSNWANALVRPGPPASITDASGNNQSGRPGEILPTQLAAVLRDSAGTALPGAEAAWQVVSGTATLNPTTSTADAFGRVSTQVTLGTTPGPVVIRLTAGTAQADFNITNNVAITGLAKVSGDTQSAAQGVAFTNPLVVRLDGTDGPVAGVPVTFTVTAGTASLSSSSATSDASGRASVTVTAGNTPGAVTVTASAAGQTQTFSLTVRQPGPVLTPASFVNGASFQPGLGFGSIATIQAEGLLSGSPAIAAGTCIASPGPGPLPTTLANIQVLFSGHLAPIFAVCRTMDNREQVSVQVPFELAPATIPVTVRTGVLAGSGAAIETTVPDIQIVNASPGIFSWQTGGTSIGVGVRPDGSVVDASNPARRGEVLRIFATGLGPVLPWVGTNQLGTPGQRTYFTPIVTLGGSGVSGVTAAYAENQIGLFTIDFTVPANAATGDVQLRLDVQTDTGNIVTGNTVTIPIL